MDSEVLFGLEPLNIKVRDYKIRKDGFIVTVFTMAGRPLGRITLSPSGEPRGVLWLRDSLVGEFFYSRKKWYVYPIENGRVARQALKLDPLSYLIQRFQREQSSAGSKGNNKTKARAAAAVR